MRRLTVRNTLRAYALRRPLVVLIVAMGVYPKPVLDIINPAVRVTDRTSKSCIVHSQLRQRFA